MNNFERRLRKIEAAESPSDSEKGQPKGLHVFLDRLIVLGIAHYLGQGELGLQDSIMDRYMRALGYRLSRDLLAAEASGTLEFRERRNAARDKLLAMFGVTTGEDEWWRDDEWSRVVEAFKRIDEGLPALSKQVLEDTEKRVGLKRCPPTPSPA